MWANFRINKYRSLRSISQRLLNPGYRFAISKKLAKTTKCTDVLLFDHIHPSDPSLGKGTKTPIGYEKCLIASLPLTASMNCHVLLQIPPLPAEMAFADELYQLIPSRKALHVWIGSKKNKESFIDLYALYKKDKKAYTALVKETLNHPPAGSNTYHFNATTKLIDSYIQGKTLILPFQMTDFHINIFKKLVLDGKAVIPDSADPWVNKGRAHRYFEMNGVGDLRPFASYISMKDIRENTHTNIDKAAKRVISACRAMQKQGKIPFIKLAANGLSGFGIITPQDNPLLNKTISKKQQLLLFQEIVSTILQGTIVIPDAVIEEYLPIIKDKEGKKEYILSGLMIDKKFYLWSISRAIVDQKGVYQGVIVSQNLADIGLDQDCIIKAYHEGERLANAMSVSGYSTGYIAKDFVLTNNTQGQERHVYHDDNDRRGGRTVADVTSALTRKGYCDRNYSLTIPKNIDYSEYIVTITDKLKEKGLRVYGTGTAYTTKKTILLRILVPLDLIRSQALQNDALSLSKAAKNLVNSVLHTE